MRPRICTALPLLALTICGLARGDTQGRLAASAADVTKALTAAKPGDTITVRGGILDLGGAVEITATGEPGRPIVIRARENGKTELVGASRFIFTNAAYVTLEGFVFEGTVGPAVLLNGCTGVRVTRNTFEMHETEKSSWILLKGVSRSNRIDHCLFQHKRQIGNFITVEGVKTPVAQVSQHDTIDHNHFRDIGPRAENALEAIRVGASDYTLSSGFTVLEHNLFERCDGDPEYISIKSCDNIIRYNTFRECLGSLSLRHGNRNRVEGNFIIGNGRSGMYTDTTGRTMVLGTGGVRFCGDSMVIVNNYMEGLTGKEWDAPLAVANGDADYGEGKSLTKHYRIRDAVIAYNTLVDNESGLEIGFDGAGFQTNWWFYPPQGLTVANNILVSSKDTAIRIFTAPLNSTWAGNIVHAKKSGKLPAFKSNGVLEADPLLERSEGFLRPAAKSPALGAAREIAFQVYQDVEGQSRKSPYDVGADQRSDEKALNRPLTARDVGPHSAE